MNFETPIGTMLKDMANAEPSFDTAADLVCMAVEVEHHEHLACMYCKAVGHTRTYCPVYTLLRFQFRGDRIINKLRGNKSAALNRSLRKLPKVIKKHKNNLH